MPEGDGGRRSRLETPEGEETKVRRREATRGARQDIVHLRFVGTHWLVNQLVNPLLRVDTLLEHIHLFSFRRKPDETYSRE